MADGKRSFLLYTDLLHTVEKMPDVQAGLLLKHILRYVNDLNPETEDLLVQVAFEPVKQSLKRDLQKYEEKRSKNKENAKKRWDAIASDGIKTDANYAVNVSVSDSVSVNDIILTDIDIGGTIQFIQLTSQRLLTEKKIQDYWTAFQIHAKDDFPKKRTDWIQHFRNWLKKQPNEQRTKTAVRTASGSPKTDYGTA